MPVHGGAWASGMVYSAVVLYSDFDHVHKTDDDEAKPEASSWAWWRYSGPSAGSSTSGRRKRPPLSRSTVHQQTRITDTGWTSVPSWVERVNRTYMFVSHHGFQVLYCGRFDLAVWPRTTWLGGAERFRPTLSSANAGVANLQVDASVPFSH